MNDELEQFKKKLIDTLSDEYSYSHTHNDYASMSTIEDIFRKMDLDKSVLDFIKGD